MKEVKLAATILLGRDKDGIFEVLLLKRNSALSFAGGFWVFPGGKIEKEELAQTEEVLSAAKIAAVRETKEESNISIDAHQLIYFRHWITPVQESQRFSTYFFFGATDALNSEVTIDDSEIKAHQWLSPQAALDQLVKGKKNMLPPTILTLQLVRKCKSVAAAQAFLSQQQPISILPTMKMEKDKIVCCFLGDKAYDTKDVVSSTARHRLTIDRKNGSVDFEFSGCGEGVIPVNGGMHL